jgi:hypothetical protein
MHLSDQELVEKRARSLTVAALKAPANCKLLLGSKRLAAFFNNL